MLLCRLEQGLLLISVAAGSFGNSGSQSNRALKGDNNGILPSAIVGSLYVLYNLLTVGVMLPVSGVSKMEWVFAENIKDLLRVMFSRYTDNWWGMAARLYPVLFGACAGLGIIAAAVVLRTRARRAPAATVQLSVYAYIFGTYMVATTMFLLSCVAVLHQRYWYYWGITLIPTICVALLLGFWTQESANRRLPMLLACLAVMLFRLPNKSYLAMDRQNSRKFSSSQITRKSPVSCGLTGMKSETTFCAATRTRS